MKDEYQSLPLINNTDSSRFEMVVEDQTSFIEYMHSPSKITLVHTEVPHALEGRGVATAMIEKTLAYIEEHHLKLIPICPMVVAYIKRHPEWKRIVDEGVKNL